VPWASSQVSECVIQLPEQGILLISNGELVVNVDIFSNISSEVKLSIDGRNSTVKGLRTSRFLKIFSPSANYSNRISLTASINRISVRIQNISIANFGSGSDDSGGCLFVSDLNTFELSHTYFTKNYGGLFGGVLNIARASHIILLSSLFSMNYATNGGVLAIQYSRNIVIQYCRFTKNTASNIGGALTSDTNADLTILGSYFIHNSATSFGGALSFSDTNTVRIRYSNFYANVAKFGSAIALGKCNSVYFGSNIVAKNVAKQAGAIFWVTISQLLEPVGLLTNNYSNNIAWNYGPNVATEITGMNCTPEVLRYDDYAASTYPLTAKVSVTDYYNSIAKLENSKIIDIAVSPSDAHCSFNSPIANVFGKVSLLVKNGVAVLSDLGANCIPGGYLLLTLRLSVLSESTIFPAYTIGSANLLSYKRFAEQRVAVKFRHCVRGEKYDFYDSTLKNTCSECINSFSFSDNYDNSVTNCMPCPTLAKSCYGDQIILYTGYWRRSSTSTNIVQCPLDKGCLGGILTGNNSCAVGYSGQICAVCIFGYFQSGTKCYSCKSQSLAGTQVVVLLVLVFLASVAFLFYILKILLTMSKGEYKFLRSVMSGTLVRDTLSGSKVIYSDDSEISSEVDEKFKRRAKLFTRLKILFATFQVISECSNSLKITFPPFFSAGLGYLSVLSLDVFNVMPFQCYLPIGYIDTMIVTTLIPFLIIGIGFVIMIYFCLLVSRNVRQKDIRKRKVESIQLRFCSYVLMFTYFIMPMVSLKIFRTFICRNLDPYHELHTNEVYMSEDLSVKCDSSNYHFGVVWAAVMVIVYPIGLPLFYFCLLYNNRRLIRSRKFVDAVMTAELVKLRRRAKGKVYIERHRVTEIISFFYASYRPDKWYWDIVETYRRLFLIAIFPSVLYGYAAQFPVSVVFCVGFIKLYDAFKPFELEADNVLVTVGNLQVLLVYYVASILKFKGFHDNSMIYS